MTGTVVQGMFEGNHTRYDVAVGGSTVIVDDFDPTSDHAPGTLVGVRIRAAGVHMISAQKGNGNAD
jgi:hypothetical protein